MQKPLIEAGCEHNDYQLEPHPRGDSAEANRGQVLSHYASNNNNIITTSVV